MAHDDNGQLVIDEAVASGTITHVAPEVFLGACLSGRRLGVHVTAYRWHVIAQPYRVQLYLACG